jgi:hypothetical protein
MEPDLTSEQIEDERVRTVLEKLFDIAYRSVLKKRGPCESSPKFIKDDDYHLVDSEFLALVMDSKELSEEQKQAEFDEYNKSVFVGLPKTSNEI